jgi:predicted lipid-binding transport protein (Tim44 family)
MRSRTRTLVKLCWLTIVAVASVALLADLAEARVGGGRSVGSRGAKTFQAPPATNTAPKTAAPMEKSMTQPGASAAAQSAQPAAGASRFGGWKGLLLGGLIGAGLASLFGFGALANVLGFVLQAALIGGIVYLAILFFRSRRAQPALATATAAAGQAAPRNANYRDAASALGGGGSALTITPDDYDAFERLLGEVQTAYGRNDVEALGDRTTPEMLSYFAEELHANGKKGVRNEVSQAKLLQGDLAEAWREGDGEYATVAMRYSIIDATVEAASGRVVSGSTTAPEEVTEVWTFRRPGNGTPRQWELSAIQQA